MICIYKYNEVQKPLREELDFYVKSEFGHIQIVKEFEWAIPHWSIIWYEDGEIKVFYNVIERIVSFDKTMYKVAGINNVITPKQHRGKGYATKILKGTEDFLFTTLKVDCGLLLCSDELIDFYSKLDWYKVDSTLYFDQEDEKKVWPANTMLLSKKGFPKLTAIEIDLRGLPW